MSSSKYDKISHEIRKKLVHMVQVEKMKIKYAGIQLGLKEATAKRIVKKYRTQGTITKFKSERQAKINPQTQVKLQQEQNPRDSAEREENVENQQTHNSFKQVFPATFQAGSQPFVVNEWVYFFSPVFWTGFNF